MADSSTTVFDISNKALKLDSAEDIEAHIAPLISSTAFTLIAFNGNTIGVPAAERLAAVLATQTSLEYINLADIFTSRLLSEIPQALDALLQALLRLPRLQTVDLSDNAFGLNTVEPLVRFLRTHVPLRHLVLNNNGMGPIAGAQIADALTELAGKKAEARKQGDASVPYLESIVCGRNRLEAGSMEAWAKAFTALGRVKSVKMTQNGIRPEGINALLRHGLANCAALEVLDLQDNTFTALGGNALADVVHSWPMIKEIGCSDCLVSARGFSAVAKALAVGKNQKVETIRAQYDEIDGKGLGELLAAAEKGGLPELRRVELNGNKFQEDDERVEKLKDILNERRKAAGVEDEEDEGWGIDQLDDMEDASDEEEEQEEEEDETEAKAEKTVQDDKKAEEEPVSQKKDSDVDALADSMANKLGL